MGSFLLGLGVGMVGGLLIAPRPGSYYRDVLGDKANKGFDYLKDKTADLRDSASGAVQKGKEAVSQQIENLAVKTNQPAVYQR
jgi:gas vesicle protein